MAEGLQYKENLQIISGGYSGEEVGSSGVIQNWTDVPAMSGSNTVNYWYRDSDLAQNANSSRVVISVTDNWSAVLNDNRTYTVTITSVVTSIKRDSIRGNPGSGTRNIFIRRKKGGSVLWSKRGDPINTAHTIATNINLGTETITLQPNGGAVSQGAIYLRNNLPGHDNTRTPSIYVDEFWVGTSFRNTLPPDYVPGMTWNGTAWLSHNRSGGTATTLNNNSTWVQMRTVNGPSGTGNPPLILHNDEVWHNERLIGQQ